MVDGMGYLFATNLLAKQSEDVIRSFDALPWDHGDTPKGMHKCAKLCKKEGGGGVCVAWTFCWNERRCSLLSRLPDALSPARPAQPTYNSRCSSGYSTAVASYEALQQSCKATLFTNTLFSDTTAWRAKNASEWWCCSRLIGTPRGWN